MARSIMITVQQKGGRLLKRVGGDGNDNTNGEFLYEVKEKNSREKDSTGLEEEFECEGQGKGSQT